MQTTRNFPRKNMVRMDFRCDDEKFLKKISRAFSKIALLRVVFEPFLSYISRFIANFEILASALEITRKTTQFNSILYPKHFFKAFKNDLLEKNAIFRAPRNLSLN